MRVLVACEFSAVVRDAFLARGHEAWSIDLLPTEGHEGWHITDDVRVVLPRLSRPFDLLIAHPPCTRLTLAGARWLYEGGRGDVRDEVKWAEMEESARFFRWLLDADVPRIAVENPKQHRHCRDIIGRAHDQVIHPWQFGHGETKETRLWLKNLPPLVPTNIVEGRAPRVHHASPGPDRWKERSRTLAGIADAMAEQWGAL